MRENIEVLAWLFELSEWSKVCLTAVHQPVIERPLIQPEHCHGSVSTYLQDYSTSEFIGLL
jgi:hypothetical protein